MTDDMEDCHKVMCADVDTDTAARVQEQIVLQSRSSFESKSSAPERPHPTTYVICTEDEAVPVPAQEQMAGAADNTVRMKSGHFPQLSCTEELVGALAGVVVGGHAGAPAA